MHTIHNARVTLLANLMNAMAGSSFTVGVAAPIAATFFYNPTGSLTPKVLASCGIWIIIAAILHLAAQRALGGLRS